MAGRQGLDAPPWHFVTGDPARVHRVLERLGLQGVRDAGSDRITHPGVYVLVDRAGRIAYRFAQGASQEPWLREAMGRLLAER